MREFIFGLVLGGLIVAGAVIYLEQKEDTALLFPRMAFVQQDDWVGFSGSLIGDDPKHAPVNNFYDVFCQRDTMQCRLASVDQIGSDYVGGINIDQIPIQEWSDDWVVADSRAMAETMRTCNWYEIRVDRKKERVEYIRFPNRSAFEAAESMCSEIQEEKIMRWRFGDGRAWSPDG